MTAPADHVRALQELLAFYAEAGVNEFVVESPVDRFAEPASPPSRAGPIGAVQETPARPQRERIERPRLGPPTTARPLAPTPPAPEVAVMAAREAARSAQSLDELRVILERFEGCALRFTASQLVFADGNAAARVMFVGEAPGREEDLEGLPFVGRSGRLLDRMMAAIGLDRSSAYICNIVPWRPPGNRTPTPQESAVCMPFIQRQIELSGADVLVCLGGPSAQTLLGVKDGILKTRGRWFNFTAGARQLRAIATLHPAYLLRSPLQKRLAWRDFLAIKKSLAEPQQAPAN